MNIYLLEQNIHNGYDTYDSVVVCANSEEEARKIHPSSFATHVTGEKWMGTFIKGGEYELCDNSWVQFDQINEIKVTLIGIANETQQIGVICASFNAG